MTLSRFTDLGASELVADALAKRGIAGAFPIQELVLPDALAGRDVCARSRTGSGKTLAFAIPIVERLQASGRSPNALILVPTRELASQVTEEFRGIADVKHLQVAAVYGGVGIGPQAKRARHADIVIATPGRLLDLVARKLIRLDRVRIAVLDEADRMLDMGFLPDVRRILALLRPDRQTMLFSATLEGEIAKLADGSTNDAIRHEIDDERPTVSTATHRFVGVPHPDKFSTLVRELAADRGLALVFVRTKRGADRVARNLKKQGFRVGALHGDMSQGQRERALGHFAAGRNDVLVATDVAARGLDLDDISHVINFDPPADDATYVHRVGRTARAGRSGTGITFVTPDQQAEVGQMAKVLKLGSEFSDAGLRASSSGQRQGTNKARGGRPAAGSARAGNAARRGSNGAREQDRSRARRRRAS